MDDVIVDLPEALVRLAAESGSLPETLELEPGVLCAFDGRWFLYARATLPLRTRDGVGFGLWVEVSPDDYARFLDATADDGSWSTFRARGTLATDWPGFENLLGAGVGVGPGSDGELAILEVDVDREPDPVFRQAVSGRLCVVSDMVRGLVRAWLDEH